MRIFIFATFLSMSLAQAQIGQMKTAPGPQNPDSEKAIKAKADLQGRNGSKVKGTVDFVQTEKGIQVQYNISGLGKQKNYGFHIHENGDCSSPDAKSAGPHYMPVADTGGTSKDSPQKHAGDLPQISSDVYGKSEGIITVEGLSINEEKGIMGRAIIVHGGPDNPNKPSPPRISCGVIR